MVFPKEIHIKLIDEESSQPIENIMFIIKLFSKTKNDFFYITNRTDPEGFINITHDIISIELKNHNPALDLFKDFNTVILIWNMSGAEINNIIKAIDKNRLHPDMSSCSRHDLESTWNHLYESRSGLYEFNNDPYIDIYFTTKRIR